MHFARFSFVIGVLAPKGLLGNIGGETNRFFLCRQRRFFARRAEVLFQAGIDLAFVERVHPCVEERSFDGLLSEGISRSYSNNGCNGHFGDVALQGVAKRGPADLTRDLELVAGKAHVVKRLEEMRCM